MNERLTPQREAEIDARAGHLYEYSTRHNDDWDVLAGEDVPALLAELAAVRAERDELERELAQARADKQQYYTALQGVARRAGLDIAPAQNQCAAEHGGPGYTRCELPVGHDGYHDSAMGNLRRATWGRPAADEAAS